MSGADIALIVAAVATPLTVILAWWEQHRAADRKEKRDESERRAARKASADALADIAAKQEQVHILVNDKSDKQEAKIDRQDAKIDELKAVIAGGKQP